MCVLQLTLYQAIGFLMIRQLSLHQFLGNLNRKIGNLILQIMHCFQLLVIDTLARILNNADTHRQ